MICLKVTSLVLFLLSGILLGGDCCAEEYSTITIASDDAFLKPQIWMQENLRVSRYRNGDKIVHAESPEEWQRSNFKKIGAWCYYGNEKDNDLRYGKLYNWYAVNDPRGIAPEGWHVPTDQEWLNLERHLGMPLIEGYKRGFRGMQANVGGKMKQEGMEHWASPNTGATNVSGFTALPGGYRFNYGTFLNVGIVGYFWSSSEIGERSALTRSLFYSNDIVSRSNNSKAYGFSVRCLRD